MAEQTLKAEPKPLWLPTTKKEMEMRGWDEVDVIIFSGDAYVDHPSFGNAVVGRYLESLGLRVAIVPQPNWRDDLRDFKKLGRPRLFFGISAGVMDSMVNKYTARKRLRKEDAYTPDGRNDMRPEYPSIVYAECIRQFYPDVPIIVGGVEASLRRLTHYDYWSDRLMPSIMVQTKADMIIYGMGEQPLKALVERLLASEDFYSLKDIPQTVYLAPRKGFEGRESDIVLYSHEECVEDKRKQAANFKHIEQQSNMMKAGRILQSVGNKIVVVNPPFAAMTSLEIDASFDLPYTRLPHPKYRGKKLGAYEMIKFSVNMHRGCFGGCAFCTISAHQGKFVASRSERSILREVDLITKMDDFKGYLSDVGGPSANMYMMRGRNLSVCEMCRRPSCIHPKICPNLNADHTRLNQLLKKIDEHPRIKKSFISSGIRYDLLFGDHHEPLHKKAALTYARELVERHVSGRLKVAPEHTSDRVLNLMRKPSFKLFYEFKRFFDQVNKETNQNQQIIPYFISSHPGCTEEDMAELAAETKKLGFRLEQIQDFTPTPMTLASEIYYTGIHPYTLEPVFTAITESQKSAQHQFFFWYQPAERGKIIKSLRRMGRPDLERELFGGASQQNSRVSQTKRGTSHEKGRPSAPKKR